MYQPSPAYLSHINSSSIREPKSKVVIAGVTYTGEEYLKTCPKISHASTSMIGGFPAKTCEFEIWDRDGTLSVDGQEIAVWRGLRLSKVSISISSDEILSAFMDHSGILTVKTTADVAKIIQWARYGSGSAGGTIEYEYAIGDIGVSVNEDADGNLIWVFTPAQEDGVFYAEVGSSTSYGQTRVIPDVEWIPMGIFMGTGEGVTRSDTGGYYKIRGTDRSQLFDRPFASDLSYPCTLGDYVASVCAQAGVSLSTPDFPLSSHVMNDPPNAPDGTTCRELVARSAEVGGCIAQITRDGDLQISKPTQTGVTIPKSYYVRLARSKPLKPINSVALGHRDYDDAFVQQDQEDIDQNGVSEWLVADNPFVDLHREEWLEDVAQEIFGMAIVPFSLQDFIDDFIFDLNDQIDIIDKSGETVTTTILSVSTKNRIRSDFGADAQEDGKKSPIAGGLRDSMKKVSLEVNHLSGSITSLAEQVGQAGEYTASMISQISSQIEFRFAQSDTVTDALSDAMNENQDLFNAYIRFMGAMIQLGRTGNDFTCELRNDGIFFLDGGNPVAYIASVADRGNSRLYIMDAQVMNVLYFSDWAIMPSGNGNLAFCWTGG
jgi:hypothetical protein